MESYGNLSGNSGVRAFETDGQVIRVEFTSGALYEYMDASDVAKMTSLARGGRGLQTYINQRKPKCKKIR